MSFKLYLILCFNLNGASEKMKLMDEMSSLKNEFELLTGQFEDLQKSKQDAVQEVCFDVTRYIISVT